MDGARASITMKCKEIFKKRGIYPKHVHPPLLDRVLVRAAEGLQEEEQGACVRLCGEQMWLRRARLCQINCCNTACPEDRRLFPPRTQLRPESDLLPAAPEVACKKADLRHRSSHARGCPRSVIVALTVSDGEESHSASTSLLTFVRIFFTFYFYARNCAFNPFSVLLRLLPLLSFTM